MHIGVGITTFLRPDSLAKCIESIHKHTDMTNVTLHIADDSIERKGVAFRKNECLRALKDCDYVFLFDDDCYPKKDGWIEFFVDNAQGEHVMFLNPLIHNPFQKIGKFIAHKDCGGVFLFLTRQHIEKVGLFNENFTPYGFEHAEYSMRIAGDREFLMLEGTEEYIYAEDYSNPNHKSSISDEEKQKCIKNNWNKFFNSEIKNVYLPL